jgi:uncharacterized protein (TIGR01777 family)
METILITGATGLIGHQLCHKLKELGYRVTTLSRTKNNTSGFQTFTWNIENQILDQEAIDTADYIIHLAGANIGERRWTKERKQFIVDSRVKSAQLLLNKIKSSNIQPKAFISASAIGFYGAFTSDKIFDETDRPAHDFLGTTCQQWESSITQFERLGIRTVLLRTGIVLTKKGGALAKMSIPVKLYLGSPLGDGKQYMPWIHIDDLCNIYIKAITDIKMQGVYNAVAPDFKTNKEFIKTLANVLHKPFLNFNIPAFLFKIIFGEMSAMLLKGSRVSPEKLLATGYIFKYTELKSALLDLLKNR